MLKKIKSDFFLKRIFILVNEEQKLKIVEYNKQLQNIIDISLINYKLFKGKYLIDESNGKVKEYIYHYFIYDNLLLYEGEYLNGQRNGGGKEYYDGNRIAYEGEYLNGKRNGKGKEFFYEGNIRFEGDFRNGKRNGGGTEYDKNGRKKYQGVYLNDKLLYANRYDYENKIIYKINNSYGLVKEYYNDNSLLFEGEYSNGERNGKGKEYYDNKLIFEGVYLNGKRNGKGKEYNQDGILIYEGQYLNGKKWDGKGYDKFNNIIYELKNGKGLIKEFLGNHLIYEGEYYLTIIFLLSHTPNKILIIIK